MSAVPAMLTMFYGALPPEVNTGRLMAGAGDAPMFQAAAGWEMLAISLETQAEELAASLVALQGSWQGAGSQQAITASTPMVQWLRTAALQAQKRAMQAIAQASAYTAALVTTPPLPEIEMNHVTNAVLNATNFLGVNTAPIGANEFDYFVRMWNQAAGAMEGYQAETSLNTVFEPIVPPKPIVMPGVGETGAATAIAQNAALMGGAVVRDATFAYVTAQGTVDSVSMAVGNAAGQGAFAAERAEGAAQNAQNAGQQAASQQDKSQQGMQMMTQVASQVGSTVAQLPQQLGQMVTQPLQQMSQPLQQFTQMFSQMGSSFGSDKGAQIGLIGASPMSNHPLAGGSGAGTGAGLVRAASLPGMGGSAARTPLMSSLVGSPESTLASAPTGAAAGGGSAGPAPVGAGAGGGPMGGAGQHGKSSGGTRPGMKAPTPLPTDTDEDDDDW
jgi:PPE-repeat protein